MNLIDIAKQYVNSREKGYAMIVPVDSDSCYLLSKQVLALQEQVRALAAEAESLREQSEEVYAAGYNHGHLNTVDGIAYAPGTKDDFYPNALQVMVEVETSDTDSVIREIRAQGVEALRDSISNIDKGIENTIDLHHYCTDFAASIRTGEQP